MTLRDLFHADSTQLPGYWIYLPRDSTKWTLETEIYIPSDSEEELVLDPAYATRDYVSTLSIDDLDDILATADRLTSSPDDHVRLEAFVYYYRFDAYLPQIGAAPPPPSEKIRQEMDRKFYDGLGPENSAEPCKAPGCARGSVRLSVFCRVHHFENVTNRSCPFTD